MIRLAFSPEAPYALASSPGRASGQIVSLPRRLIGCSLCAILPHSEAIFTVAFTSARRLALRRRRRHRRPLSFFPLNLTSSSFLLSTSLLSQLSSRPAVAAPRPTPARRGALHVVAARVAGVEIPNAKRVEASLQYIFGVGPTTAKAILTDTNIENKRTRDLSEAELTTLRDEVEKYTTEGDLRRFNALNINRLKEIGCYRGRRHINSLPVRGQRTKTNARTRKGKAKTVANKKK